MLRAPALATWYGLFFRLRTGLSLPEQDACEYSITLTPQEYDELDYGLSERDLNMIPGREFLDRAKRRMLIGIVKKARMGGVVWPSFRFA